MNKIINNKQTLIVFSLLAVNSNTFFEINEQILLPNHVYGSLNSI